jgi:hypothetical protein
MSGDKHTLQDAIDEVRRVREAGEQIEERLAASVATVRELVDVVESVFTNAGVVTPSARRLTIYRVFLTVVDLDLRDGICKMIEEERVHQDDALANELELLTSLAAADQLAAVLDEQGLGSKGSRLRKALDEYQSLRGRR